MNKPFTFYASIISGFFLLACALAMLGFAIYFIAIGLILEFFILLFCTIVCGYLGAIALLHGLKLDKAINTVSTILSLYPDFEKTNSFDIQTQSSKKSSLLVDANNKKFIFVLFDHVVPMYSFSDLVGYDVYENSAKIFSTTRENPSFDRNLGWAGARGGNAFTDRVYSLQIVLHLKDALNPQVVINFLSNKGVDRLSVDYREYINSANKLCSKLDQLLA